MGDHRQEKLFSLKIYRENEVENNLPKIGAQPIAEGLSLGISAQNAASRLLTEKVRQNRMSIPPDIVGDTTLAVFSMLAESSGEHKRVTGGKLSQFMISRVQV